jgi:hypothetical protein
MNQEADEIVGSQAPIESQVRVNGLFAFFRSPYAVRMTGWA